MPGNRLICFHYRVKDALGNTLESSHCGRPISYFEGHHKLLSRIDRVVRKLRPGDRTEVYIPALDAYADRAARIEGATLVALGVWLVHRLLTALLDWTQRGVGRVVDRAVQVLPLGRRALNIATLAIGVLLVLDQLGTIDQTARVNF